MHKIKKQFLNNSALGDCSLIMYNSRWCSNATLGEFNFLPLSWQSKKKKRCQWLSQNFCHISFLFENKFYVWLCLCLKKLLQFFPSFGSSFLLLLFFVPLLNKFMIYFIPGTCLWIVHFKFLYCLVYLLSFLS